MNCPKFGYSGSLICKTLLESGLSVPCIEAKDLADAVSHARTIATYGSSTLTLESVSGNSFLYVWFA